MKQILLVASECVPFIKTGGLADVIGSLPKYIPAEEYQTAVLLPGYACIAGKWKEGLQPCGTFTLSWQGEERQVRIWTCRLEGVDFYFLENAYYFAGDSPYYGDDAWNVEKFAFFCRATIEAFPYLAAYPALVHCNDWHTGLLPVYLAYFREEGKDPRYQKVKTIMTVHNMQFQGVGDLARMMSMTGLPEAYFTQEGLESYGSGNMLKGGLAFADALTTVSPTYAREIQQAPFGERLEGLLYKRQGELYGIVNGLDYQLYNPEKDPLLAYTYTTETVFAGKLKNKRQLQEKLGLAPELDTMLLGVVSRLTGQKGFDLVEDRLEALCRLGLQLVVLGTGEARYERLFRAFAKQYPRQISANICYSDLLAHQIYGGADALLMPSRFEPCGLSQLIALRYGTLPIVRRTGGLQDTITPYREGEAGGNGFGFEGYDPQEMWQVIRQAKGVYETQKETWQRLVRQAMGTDFSWKKSAEAYGKLYKKLLI